MDKKLSFVFEYELHEQIVRYLCGPLGALLR